MFNIFKKKSGQNGASVSDNASQEEAMPKMNMLQRMAMKKLEKMSPEERQKVRQEALKPENKDKILQVMEMMKKSGQISEDQIELAKKQLGL